MVLKGFTLFLFPWKWVSQANFLILFLNVDFEHAQLVIIFFTKEKEHGKKDLSLLYP